ncbi:hypothetical protein E4J66_13490 [Actinomyces viscosus]|uniref:Uncharacterized protein n=1 Tax=Actinomyces viscosus TaxID=1656 RepID=A0A448PLY9_ACTVI|nr:hypothetical protein [Actinomyces viscosus]TFH51008.1 hypothetical protein E4J66_13490 [Actinomyces viscosus]VEI16740.1 Uncharacterised protein [Actinomyces viscosus]
MSFTVAFRRVRTTLAALAAFAVVAAMALVSPPGQTLNELNVAIDMNVTVKSDDIFEASFVITDQTNYSWIPPITEDRCNLDYFLLEPNIFANAETKFDDGKDKRVCTITRKGKISETNGAIKHDHDNNEYSIDTTSMNGRKTPPEELQLYYAATFPGKVTQSAGGEVKEDAENTVSFRDFKGRVVKGQDRPASEMTTRRVLPWIIGGVGALVAAGLIATAVVVRRRQQREQGTPGPYPQAAPAQGAVPQQPHLSHATPQPQYPVQTSSPQSSQQYPVQPSPPYSPSDTVNRPYPPSPTQTPQQRSSWPPPQQPQ